MSSSFFKIFFTCHFKLLTFPILLKKTPKRSQAASAISTTGHVDSPATLVIGRKLAKTPKPLPKKGRKSFVKKVLNTFIESV